MTFARVAALAAILSGSATTLFFYVALFVVQTVNGDDACESYPASVQGADFSDARSIGSQNSWLNLGGSCTYHMKDDRRSLRARWTV